MDINTASVQLAIEGLEEGYRVIASSLNFEFEKRELAIRIDCEKKRPSDSLFKAREKMRRALPKLPCSLDISSNLSTVCPWTLGRLGGPDSPPWPIYLSDESDTDILSFISDCFTIDSTDHADTKLWHECIVDVVTSNHNRWQTFLKGLLPAKPPAKYSLGEEGFRRDKLIYELACGKWTNKAIAEEILSKSGTEKWEFIGEKTVTERIKEYCRFMKLDPPKRNGRPKKTSR